MKRIPRPWIAGLALLTTGLLGVTIGGGELPRPARLNTAALAAVGTSERHSKASKKPVKLDITPSPNAKNLPITTEIGTNVSHGTVSAVRLTEQGGGQVAGAMRPDGTSWIPNQPLKLGKTYDAQVKASGSRGRTATKTTTFATMKSADTRVPTGVNMLDAGASSFGVALPVAVRFDQDVPPSARAGVERRLFVTSNPPQPGVWRWFTGREALYRPQSYWKPGTKLTVRAALDGVPLGDNRFGDKDYTASGTIGRDFEMKVDNDSKAMSVYQQGKLVRTMPVSLGKASTPSSSGTMVVMQRSQETVFDTTRELGPTEGYRTNIEWAQRITWGGQFIHSAPWSVGDQGVDNVSHGCVNLSPDDAEWLFDRTEVGDPITVRGTEVKLDPGDGWTVWDMSWADYLKSGNR